jgi:dTDP-glucose 4,6-dehydratase
VKNYCSVIRCLQEVRHLGAAYNLGGLNEKFYIEIVKTVCTLLYEFRLRADVKPYAEQIIYVTDSSSHDRRYVIDTTKIHRKLGWKPTENFKSVIRKTVHWYLDNSDWVANVQSGEYSKWLDRNYACRKVQSPS